MMIDLSLADHALGVQASKHTNFEGEPILNRY
jgi:hypothetical protein